MEGVDGDIFYLFILLNYFFYCRLIDWITHKVYQTDVDRGHVAVSQLDGTHRKVLYREGIGDPYAIALDTNKVLNISTLVFGQTVLN